MRNVKRIVVGLNFTELDADTIRTASDMTKFYKPEKITFIHVVPIKHISEGLKREFTVIKDLEKTKMYDYVNRYVEFPQEIPVEFIVREGNVLDELVKEAVDPHVDLLILGRRDKADSRRRLVEKVSGMVDSSVLVVPKGSTRAIRKILVPVDFSAHSKHAVREAALLAGDIGIGEMTLLHVYDVARPYPVIYDDFMVAPRDSTIYRPQPDELLKESQEQYEKFVKECEVSALGISLDPVFQKDTIPERKIGEMVGEGNFDMVVLGSRGHSGTALMLVGSIVENLIWKVNVPMFIVKEKGRNVGVFKAFFGGQ